MQVVHGACGMAPLDFGDRCISASYASLLPTEPQRIDIGYLDAYATTKQSYDAFFRASHGVHIEKMTFNLEEWLNGKIELPPLPEQKKIAEILSGIDNGIAALKQSKRIRMAAHEQAMAEFINKSMGTTQDLEEMGYEVLDGDRGDAYPKEKDFSSNGYCLFLSAKNVTKSGFNFGSCQYISREKDCEMRKGRLERGDIVITTRGTLGNIAYFDDSIPIRTMRINSGMAIIRARASKNSGKEEFLLSCLLSDFVQNQIRKASFGTAQNQLTLGIIKRLRFPVLSIANEILFTKQCNALSSYGKKLQEGIGKREHLKQTIASDLLSGRKRVSV